MPSKILVIDDEKSVRTALKDIFEMEKYKVEEAVDGKEGYNLLKVKEYDCVLCDIKMPKINGMELLEKVQNEGIDVPMIMISGHGNTDTAVEAVRLGAFDYIAKPPDLNRLLITVRNALDHGSLKTEAKELKRQVKGLQDIIGESPAIQEAKSHIDKVAPTDARVLILGANGSGKELVARWLHEKSSRNKAPFIEVNCAAIPTELIESELFGHEKGSFTGAMKQHIGKFEQANGGTLFLDEIGDMSPEAQAKVLRVLQENKLSRIGGDKEISVDVRVLTATNKDLKDAENNFREDLFHRLGVIIINVPSLNERREDIPLLTNHFLNQTCKEYNKAKPKINDDAMEAIVNHNWTGNIRELQNIVQRLIIFCDKQIDLALVNSCMNK